MFKSAPLLLSAFAVTIAGCDSIVGDMPKLKIAELEFGTVIYAMFDKQDDNNINFDILQEKLKGINFEVSENPIEYGGERYIQIGRYKGTDIFVPCNSAKSAKTLDTDPFVRAANEHCRQHVPEVIIPEVIIPWKEIFKKGEQLSNPPQP